MQHLISSIGVTAASLGLSFLIGLGFVVGAVAGLKIATRFFGPIRVNNTKTVTYVGDDVSADR